MGPITPKSISIASQGESLRAQDAAAGQEEAFTALFDTHQREVYRTALAILTNHEAALDAVQETFIKVHRGRQGFRGDSSLRTWIIRIAIRCAIDIRRRTRPDHGAAPHQTEPSHDPRGEIEMSLRIAGLRKLADHLPGQSGEILRLRLFGGFSNKEIASHLDLSEANVRVQLTTAVRRLREML